MARQGAPVVGADLVGQRAAEHAGALAREGHESLAVEVDIASDESVAAAFGVISERFGGVDILVNNAAPSRFIAKDAPALHVGMEIWDVLQNVVVRGALVCSRHALPSMIDRGGGSIVNVASILAHAGTRALATQYGRQGIRCNTVTLGTIPYPSMSAQARQNRVKHQLIPREGQPADAANLVAFLASPASSFLTGADFVADGGTLAHLPSYADGGTWGVMRNTTNGSG
jgi:NAD(P)-dependent dehydrogenase (short-subunit alcohol dehydrogenase family)